MTASTTETAAVIERYIPLLKKRAHRWVGDGMPYEEAYAWGALGLVKAARYYDPSRNFASLAIRAIDSSITDGLRSSLGRNNIKRQNLSMSQMPNFDVAANDDTHQEIELLFIRAEVKVALESLDQRQRVVIRLHYWLGKPMTQIAEALEITTGAAQKLHRNALACLQNELAHHRNESNGVGK